MRTLGEGTMYGNAFSGPYIWWTVSAVHVEIAGGWQTNAAELTAVPKSSRR